MSADLLAWSKPRSSPSQPPRLIVGAMNFGKRTEEREAQRIVDRAIERGVVHFDTANAYVSGRSEEILGRAVAARRDRVVLASKVGLFRLGADPSGLLQAGGSTEGLSHARILAACDESLSRLGTDVIDVYYLHVPDRSTPIEPSLEALSELLNAGKIRSWAVSNYASWQVLEMIDWCDRHGFVRPLMTQQIYNLLVRQLEIEYLHFAARYAVPTAAYNPLAGGVLTDRTLTDVPPEGSRLDGNPMYQKRYGSERFQQCVQDYQALARDASSPLVDLAYGWLASRPGVDAILLGPGSVAHLDAAIDACERRYDPELLARLDELHRRHQGTDAVYARL
jgi:aryl-alcohol dehydrogenase-like predicted oxidoreductase